MDGGSAARRKRSPRRKDLAQADCFLLQEPDSRGGIHCEFRHAVLLVPFHRDAPMGRSQRCGKPLQFVRICGAHLQDPRGGELLIQPQPAKILECEGDKIPET